MRRSGQSQRLQVSHADADRLDLKGLYTAAWFGELTHVTGIPIQLIKPFHQQAAPPAPV